MREPRAHESWGESAPLNHAAPRPRDTFIAPLPTPRTR